MLCMHGNLHSMLDLHDLRSMLLRPCNVCPTRRPARAAEQAQQPAGGSTVAAAAAAPAPRPAPAAGAVPVLVAALQPQHMSATALETIFEAAWAITNLAVVRHSSICWWRS